MVHILVEILFVITIVGFIAVVTGICEILRRMEKGK